MTVVLYASNFSLHEVEEKFNLQEVWDQQFFPEWQGDLPEITTSEKQWLDQIKTDFLNLAKYSVHEEIVKIVVLAPLLMFAGLLRHPFLPVAEQQVEISLEEESEIVRGKIDVLVLHQKIWVALIESKRKGFNVLEALPQVLFYMMNSSSSNQPGFGLVTNGSEFRFVKLIKGEPSRYALSDLFTLQRHENDLYAVLGILKKLGQLAIAV